MNPRQTEGQVVVWVAVLLVALLLFAGLAIDVGAGLAVRREMQNAADAGALAGAYELCYGDPSRVAATAREMALDNGAELPVDVQVEGGTVRVVAGVATNTSLLGLLGVSEYGVRASAAAVCERSRSACGLWPIGVPKSMWDETPCDTHIYAWDDEKVATKCEDGVWACRRTKEGAPSEKFVGMGDRGWLDFRGMFDPDVPHTCPNSGGANLLKALIDGCAGKLSIPKCIPGEPGVNAGVKKHVEARVGDLVYIPLFDSVGCGANGKGYYVVDFGCAEVVAWHQNLTIYGTDPQTGKTVEIAKNTKAIEIKISCGNCEAPCTAPSGDPAGAYGDVIGVGLIE